MSRWRSGIACGVHREQLNEEKEFNEWKLPCHVPFLEAARFYYQNEVGRACKTTDDLFKLDDSKIIIGMLALILDELKEVGFDREAAEGHNIRMWIRHYRPKLIDAMDEHYAESERVERIIGGCHSSDQLVTGRMQKHREWVLQRAANDALIGDFREVEDRILRSEDSVSRLRKVKKVDDAKALKGIGPKKLAAIKDKL